MQTFSALDEVIANGNRGTILSSELPDEEGMYWFWDKVRQKIRPVYVEDDQVVFT